MIDDILSNKNHRPNSLQCAELRALTYPCPLFVLIPSKVIHYLYVCLTVLVPR